jgi:hypothetical protein
VDDPVLGEVGCLVWDIDEDDDSNFRILAKELPSGLVKMTNSQSMESTPLNKSVSPGPVNPPLLFQPPLQLTSVGEIWAAVSGGDGTTANPYWGGCYVHISLDDITYTLIGEITNPARQGKLTGGLPMYGGDNPDVVNTLSVDMSMSGGVLESITSPEVDISANLSVVDEELLGFETATLTGPGEYDLTDLYRGLDGSVDVAHLTDAPFARLDDRIFQYVLPDEYIDKTIYMKFQSYNVWKLMEEDLSTCVTYTFTPAVLEIPDIVYDGGDAYGNKRTGI